MNAIFKLEGQHRPVIELTPDYGVEAILAAAFIRYDANLFRVSVERHENGQIKTLTIYAESSE